MPAKKIRRSAVLALALLMAAAVPVRATGFPAITLVDVVRPGTEGSGALYGDSERLGDYLYFGATDSTHGNELWRTNGTTTALVSDINTGNSGADGSYPDYFTALGDYLYFRADDGTHGTELWRTDGSTTALVSDINTGTSGADGSYPYAFTALGAYLYFTANDSTHGNELWRTNGTTTELVSDINTGANDSYPYAFTALGAYLYFGATDSTHGNELWRTNGTTTALVSDINTTGDSDPYGFTALGDYLYFQAYDGTYGRELWRTDGTAAGTTRVKDIRTTGNSNPYAFTALGDYLYFGATDSTHGNELWRTNGTTTALVSDINTGNSGADGSYPDAFTALGGYLYFQANDGTHGDELWRTNGTALGTTLVTDIYPGSGGGGIYSSYPYGFTALGDYLYFTANDGNTGGLWRVEGTGATETSALPGTNAIISCMCLPLTSVDGRLFFVISNDESGGEFAYLDEPTYVLPETNRAAGTSSAWTIALSALALVTLAAGVGLRRRAGVPKR